MGRQRQNELCKSEADLSYIRRPVSKEKISNKEKQGHNCCAEVASNCCGSRRWTEPTEAMVKVYPRGLAQGHSCTSKQDTLSAVDPKGLVEASLTGPQGSSLSSRVSVPGTNDPPRVP